MTNQKTGTEETKMTEVQILKIRLEMVKLAGAWNRTNDASTLGSLVDKSAEEIRKIVEDV